MANEQNLTQAGKPLSTEEAQRIGKKGGKASVESKRKRKAMRETLEAILPMSLKDGKLIDVDEIKNFADMNGKNITIQDAIIVKLIQKALKGDVQSVNIIRELVGERVQELAIVEPPIIIDDYEECND